MALKYQVFLGLFIIVSFFVFHVISLHSNDNVTSSLGTRDRFEQWLGQHGRVYKNEAEKEKRFFIFENNMKSIDAVNNDNKSYKFAPNAFTDLTDEEFLARFTGLNIQFDPQNKTTSIFSYNSTLNELPNFVDWRQNGAVTSVKNQGSCGACWAFAAVATLEGIYKIKMGTLVDFSEQNLIDCDNRSHGCRDGTVSHAFEYMMSKGISVEYTYPYVGKEGQCKEMFISATIKNYQTVGQKDENALMAAVSQQPVSIAIDSTGFRHYGSGVYDGGCSSNIHHAVVVVGYGKDDKTRKDYWLLKNSWGENWGEKGYLKLLRDEAACPITINAHFLVFKSQ